MDLNKTYFADVYNSACYATDELSKARQLLGRYHYLTSNEHKLLRQALHLLYKKNRCRRCRYRRIQGF